MAGRFQLLCHVQPTEPSQSNGLLISMLTTNSGSTSSPKAEQIIRICEGVTAARIEGDNLREEILYWELIDIMRSPEMIKLITRNYLEHKKKIEKVHAKNQEQLN